MDASKRSSSSPALTGSGSGAPGMRINISDREDVPLLVEEIDFRSKDSSTKSGSLGTILALANTMLGSSLLAIPWGFTQSGFAAGMAVVLVVGFVCFYTAYLIVKNGRGEEDFSAICLQLFGKGGFYLSIFTSILILIGALTAFDIIMSASFHDLVRGVKLLAWGDEGEVSFDRWWGQKVPPLVVILILFPFMNLKNISALVKINFLGVLAIIYLVFYIPFVSFFHRIEDIKFREEKELDQKFFYLAGILTLAFFSHNFCLSVLKNNKNQKNNGRDIFFAYMIVAFLYAIIGGSAYLSFSHIEGGIPQDFLTHLSETNIGAMIARFVVVLQLFSVYPLVAYIIRIQFFGLFHKNPSWPGLPYVLALNVFLCLFTTAFAIWYPQIADVLRFTGAFCGFVYVFLLPIGVHWKIQKQEGNLTTASVVANGFILLLGLGSVVAQVLP